MTTYIIAFDIYKHYDAKQLAEQVNGTTFRSMSDFSEYMLTVGRTSTCWGLSDFINAFNSSDSDEKYIDTNSMYIAYVHISE